MNDILKLFNDLYEYFGPQYWWPADSEFEVMVGAILTQNVNWKNLEKPISKLKEEELLDPEEILKTDDDTLHKYLRPTGFYRQKTERLKLLSKEVVDTGGVERFLNTDELRIHLLNIKGIGPETADSIILYAANIPYFVVDAYTKRILKRRYGIEGSYEEIQEIFHKNLPQDVSTYQEYHALLVKLAKRYCKVKPICEKCPVTGNCGYSTQRAASSSEVCPS